MSRKIMLDLDVVMELIDDKVELRKLNVGKSNCPYRVYGISNDNDTCADCDKCEGQYYSKYRKQITTDILGKQRMNTLIKEGHLKAR